MLLTIVYKTLYIKHINIYFQLAYKRRETMYRNILLLVLLFSISLISFAQEGNVTSVKVGEHTMEVEKKTIVNWQEMKRRAKEKYNQIKNDPKGQINKVEEKVKATGSRIGNFIKTKRDEYKADPEGAKQKAKEKAIEIGKAAKNKTGELLVKGGQKAQKLGEKLIEK